MPADPGLGRVVAFQNWPSIDITFLASADLAKKLVDLIELACDQVVIVIAPGIARDFACSRRRVAGIPASLEIIQRQNNNRPGAWQHLVRVTALFFPALHVTHFAMCFVVQPIPKLMCMRRRAITIDRICSCSGHRAVAGIGDAGPDLRQYFLNLLKIATATSSSVSSDVSMRISAIFAYSGSRARNILVNALLGFLRCNNGRLPVREARLKSVFSSASSHTTTPNRFKRSMFSSRKTIPPPVTMIAP